MFNTYNQLIHQQPWVTIISLVACLGIAIVVLVVWKEVFNFDFWEDE